LNIRREYFVLIFISVTKRMGSLANCQKWASGWAPRGRKITP
jgi:hypothetical protein